MTKPKRIAKKILKHLLSFQGFADWYANGGRISWTKDGLADELRRIVKRELEEKHGN